MSFYLKEGSSLIPLGREAVENPKTLADWRQICIEAGGEGTEALKFLDDKIAAQGADQPVLTPDSQMVYLLKSLLAKRCGS